MEFILVNQEDSTLILLKHTTPCVTTRLKQSGLLNTLNLSRDRSKKLCSVDKANVLEVSQLWRTTIEESAINYEDIELTHMYVDNAAMQLVQNPKRI